MAKKKFNNSKTDTQKLAVNHVDSNSTLTFTLSWVSSRGEEKRVSTEIDVESSLSRIDPLDAITTALDKIFVDAYADEQATIEKDEITT